MTNDNSAESLNSTEELSSKGFSKEHNLNHQDVVGVVKSLQSRNDVIQCTEEHTSYPVLTQEGEGIVEDGSHEVVLFNAIPKEGISQKTLMDSDKNAKIGFSKAMASKWIRVEKNENNEPIVHRLVESVEDKTREDLKNIRNGAVENVDEKTMKDLKKRKLVQDEKVTYYIVRKGTGFTLTPGKEITELTEAMIISGEWKQHQFKMLKYDALGAAIPCGHLHPLLKVRTEYRRILMDMGFSEMPTNNYVESSFWNFDALFQPQQHPARDAHDTFFVSDPAECFSFPEDYMERVKQVHSIGGYGSCGYQYDWKLSEAKKNILRTHTTAVSTRMLYKLAHEVPFRPKRYFSIDRVFRNEALDATHLAEFHQIEGLIADVGLTLGDLKGIIHEFFRKLGLTRLRFKPAYNPYTEPSMEIFSYHEGLGKWIEVGNSGVFRPEMLEPMGLPPNVVCIAWGLSLERPTMIKYGYKNIRDLIGPKVDLQMVYDSPCCRLDKV